MKFSKLPPAVLSLVVAYVLPTNAQYVAPGTYQTTMKSPVDPNITVSYKQPTAGTCQTVYSAQKQYTGYIRMPPFTLAPIQQNYSINYFFWFIEARQSPETAPLTLYLNGGPGSSSMVGLFNEVGPCEVVQMDDGSYGTQYRMWGWDRSSNIIFIDQPNQVGFSYDTSTNASFDAYSGQVFEPPTPPDPHLPSYMYLNGTFGTASFSDETPWSTTANTTQISAQAIWHFLQAWLSSFPQYNPATRPNSTASSGSDVPAGVNLFSESYGGKYGSAFASFFEQQNHFRSNGTLPKNTTLAIQLQSVGIINGLIDDLIQDYYYPLFAYNNTYSIQVINEVDELNDINLYNSQCSGQIQSCRQAMETDDPNGYGDDASTNSMCEKAQLTCNQLQSKYAAKGYYPYDIRQKYPSPDPPAAYQEYLNTETVLASIGASVNYTESNRYVQSGYISTGDTIRGGMLEDLAYLLANNIRVGLIYGDADYVCNWLGGQAVSLAVAGLLADYPVSTSSAQGGPPAGPVPYASGFPGAGYAEIVVNNSYVGGAVRQYGNLSFSRIYDAGHFVPYFQPETAFTVFTRLVEGTEVATGALIDLSTYRSSGPANSTYTASGSGSRSKSSSESGTATAAAYSPSQTCWVRAWNQSCGSNETEAMLAGSGTVAFGRFFLDQAATGSGLPAATVSAAVPGHPVDSGTSSVKGGARLTGVYTATGTPSPSKGVAAAAGRGRAWFSVVGAPIGMSGVVGSACAVALAFAGGVVLLM